MTIPVPYGRGVWGGGRRCPGPGASPPVGQKGSPASAGAYRAKRKKLTDRFNTMIRGVAALGEFPHVKYVNLRGTLSVGADYETWWGNELHPTKRGFERVTERFATALAALP